MAFDLEKEMHVTKRNGTREAISFDKILRRVKKLGEEIHASAPGPSSSTKAHGLNYTNLVMKVIDQLYDGITTTQIDELTADQCATMSSTHPDYNALAARIAISNHHKHTSCSFVKTMKKLYQYVDIHGKVQPLVSDELYKVVATHGKALDAMMEYSRDYLIDYFGFKTLLRSYLMKVDHTVVERPQHMWMRVAVGIHGSNLERVRETYTMMSQKWFTHATPTLYNAGTPHPQLSSCFLEAMESDSIDGIYKTLHDCALISKWAGGIGIHIHNIRASGSHIQGTNGSSNGIVPMLRVFNHTAKYVDQCVHPDTVIYTSRGPMRIQDVEEGCTEIVNGSGEVEVVQKVIEHPFVGEMLTLATAWGQESLRITSEHPMVVITEREGREAKSVHGSVASSASLGSAVTEADEDTFNLQIKAQWTDAGNVRVGDYLAMPVPVYEKDVDVLTPDDAYIYGMFLARGTVIEGTYQVSTTGMPLAVRSFLEAYLTTRCVPHEVTRAEPSAVNVDDPITGDHVDFHASMTQVPPDPWTSTSIQWHASTVLPFRYADVYVGHQVQHIHPRWLNLPLAKAQQVLKGMIDAGGSIGTQVHYASPSPLLIQGLRYLCLRLGVLTQVTQPTHIVIPPTETICDLLEVHWDGRPSPFKRVAGNILLNPVTAITKHMYRGLLYDLSMAKEHNYLLSEALVHNGGGKRKGSFAIYLEPWHADIASFLQMKKNLGDEELKARDLFYALWIPDLFMRRVKEAGKWTLMCPYECPGLSDVYGEAFDALYEKYEAEGKGRSTVPARDLWFQVLDAQMETGTPYLLFKDACNRKSNQKNLGTIKSSNLCVAPETRILTDLGEFPIHSLWGQRVNVWNGQEYSEVEVVKTGDNQPLLDVQVMNDEGDRFAALNCTPYHKFYIQNDDDADVRTVEARDLLPGDKIAAFDVPDHGAAMFTDQHIHCVVDRGRHDTTYCFEEPLRHAGVFNGIYTSQCTEIVQHSDSDHTSVCNLASIALPSCVDLANGRPTFDFDRLHHIARTVTYNLNRVIDVNYYPIEKARRSNVNNRPIGIGVQGLADVYMMMNLNFGSDEAKALNRHIFETIYHAALEESCALAATEGTYPTYAGSPASQGLLQFDLWTRDDGPHHHSGRYNWDALKARIAQHGLRNSLLVAPMPTASTSQILGYNECFEPITSNIYSRRTLAGEFVLTNKYLMRDLLERGLWNEKMKNTIVANNGSIQAIESIPKEVRDKYRTVWEIPMKTLIDMSADRGIYICQSQSLNLWIEDPTYNNLTSMHFYSWQKGLKTGIYYLRRRAKHQAQQFTIEPEKRTTDHQEEEEEEVCEMCSS